MDGVMNERTIKGRMVWSNVGDEYHALFERVAARLPVPVATMRQMVVNA